MISKYDKDGKLKKKKERKTLSNITKKIKGFLFINSKKDEILLRGRKNKKITFYKVFWKNFYGQKGANFYF